MTDRPDLRTYEVAFQRVFAAIAAADEGGKQPWVTRVSGGLGAIVELFATDPALAHTVVIEAVAAGPEARRLHEDALDRLAGQLDPGPELVADHELPEQISLMAVGSVSGLIFKEVLAGRAEQLQARMPDLLFTLLVPYLGPRVAAAEVDRAGLSEERRPA
jgi:hypothetical protein